MLFNSYAFMLVYLPVVLFVFALLARHARGRRVLVGFLSVASLAFYAYWDYRYLPLLAASIGFNFLVGRALVDAPVDGRSRKPLLALGLVGDLGLLAYFKYAGFFVDSTNRLFDLGLPVPEIILPIGISFYTFTQIEYLVDAYRGNSGRYRFLEYLLFVTFFPHLIAGPILCHRTVIPQFAEDGKLGWTSKAFVWGFTFFAIGLFKKTVIADSLSEWVAVAFGAPDALTLIDSWAAGLAYTFQLYFDFSGYSDMAVGLGLMLGVELPFNFDSPYRSRSIAEFWRRWHITLSNFLRDYLYFPLGGSRCSGSRRTVNLMATMLLGGLWHGAGWTFVLWGGWHGALLSANHAYRKSGLPSPPRAAGWLLTFAAVVLGWVVFRAGSVSDAGAFLAAMFGLRGVVLPPAAAAYLGWLQPLGVGFGDVVGMSSASMAPKLGLLAVLTAAVLVVPNTQEVVRRLRPTRGWLLFVGTVFCAALLGIRGVSEFLYFQF